MVLSSDVEHCIILGDVTYGACCVDDFSAGALECEFLVHYGHSCLVPVDVTNIPCMYVFVNINIDMQHFLDTLRLNFPEDSRIAVAGTIQFASSVQQSKAKLGSRHV